MTPMPTLFLHGAPRVRLPGGIDRPLSAREAALLAWLHLEGPTPRARLAERLWPEGRDAQARANLRQTLARLRRAASALWTEGDAGLALAPGVAVADDDGQPLLGALRFDDAEALSRWLDERRAAQQRDRQRQARERLRCLLDEGRLDDALAASDALLAADPEAEEAWRLRMELFYLRGDRAAALAAWDDARHALRQAFGVSPSDATNALGRLILSSPAAMPQAVSATALPAALRRPPRLVGRDRLLADAQRCLALGHAVVLTGSGGLGKSRLLQELAARHAQSLFVPVRPGDALTPGVVLGRLLARALAQWPPVLDDATRQDLDHLLPGRRPIAALPSALEHRRVLAAAVRALHACHQQGLALVLVDDLQFADDASLAALQVLLGHWAQDLRGALPVLGARADELSPTGQALLAQLAASGRATRFDLAPLQTDELQALLQALPLPEPPADAAWCAALAGTLRGRVGGNPAHVLESLKSLWLDGIASWAPGQDLPLPPTLVDAVRGRLLRLDDDALRLAQLAAVAGADFSLTLAGGVLGRPALSLAPLLATLEASQVFHGPAFAHDLVADAVRASIPAPLAAALHGLVADQLAARADAGDAAARIAQHLQAAGNARGAVRWHLQAAHRARAQWQMAAAAQSFEAAAQATDPADRGAAAAAWHEAARCWLPLRRNDEAGRALDAAQALARSPGEHARLLPARTAWLFNSRRIAEAVASADALIDAVAALGPEIEARDLAFGLRTVGVTVAWGTDLDRALAMADRVQALIGADDADARRLLHIARGGLLHWAARPRDAEADLQAAWPPADAAHEAGTRITLANQLMRVRHALGDLPGALALGHALLVEAAPLDLGVVVITDVMHVLAMIEVASGQAATGMARWAEVQCRLHAAGQPMPELYLTSQALACIALGRHDEAAAWLERHPAPGRPGQALQDLGWQLSRARLAAVRGEDPSRWLAAAAQADGLPPGLQLQRQVATVSLAPPPYDTLPPLLERLRARGLRGQQRTTEIAAARAAWAAGRADRAVAHARTALALADHVDAWIDEAASVWLAAAQVLADCGCDDEAAAAVAAGARWVLQGAAAWPDGAHRAAWLDGNPVHRRLLQLQAAAQGGVERGGEHGGEACASG